MPKRKASRTDSDLKKPLLQDEQKDYPPPNEEASVVIIIPEEKHDSRSARHRLDFFGQIKKSGVKETDFEKAISALNELIAQMFTLDELKKLTTVSKKFNILFAPILEKISKNAHPDRLLLKLAKNYQTLLEEKQRLELMRAGSLRLPMTDIVTSPATGQRITKYLILAILALTIYGSKKLVDALPDMPEAAEISLRIGIGALAAGFLMHGLLNLEDMRRTLASKKILFIENEPIAALTEVDKKGVEKIIDSITETIKEGKLEGLYMKELSSEGIRDDASVEDILKMLLIKVLMRDKEPTVEDYYKLLKKS